MAGYIDNYASPDNPVIDITGTPLTVLLNFVAKGASAPADVQLAASGAPGIPPAILALLTTPLNQMGDQVWAQNLDQDRKTLRDRTQATIAKQISDSVARIGPGYSAELKGIILPTTGAMKSIVLSNSLTNKNASQVILLSYQLTDLTALFSVTTPFTGGIIPDPDYKLTFDVELLVSVLIPLGVGPLTSVASFNVENANISADNFTADVGDAILTGINFLSGQPTNIFQAFEGAVDTSSNASGLGALDSLLSQLGTFWSFASGTLGFKDLRAFIDGAPALNMRFTHPVDAGPTATNGADSPFPSLFHPQLGITAPVVRAGDSLGVTGSNFPAAQDTQLLITWNDTTSGIAVQSDIQWGAVNGPLRVDIKPRKLFDNQNFFLATNLPPGAPFTFSVRDQDLLTETPFGEPLILTTDPTNLIELSLGQSGGPQRALGSAKPSLGGSFATTVVIPADLADGIYTLSAALAGSVLAIAVIRVVSAGSTVPPTIEAIDPATNIVVKGIIEGEAVTFRGEGFRPGTIAITIDTGAGQALATSPADASGNFQTTLKWPVGVLGAHTVVAEQTAGGPTLDATTDLFVQQIPR